MDPDVAWGGVQVAYGDLRHALDTRDAPLAAEAARVLADHSAGLAEWFSKGGYLPGGARST